MRNSWVATNARVATIALLLVGFTSVAAAQEPKPQDSEDCKPGDGPPCYLTSQHYDALGGRIEALKVRIEALRGQLETVSGAVEEASGPAAEALKAKQAALEDQIGALTAQLESLTGQLGRVADGLERAILTPPWAGWKWGVGAFVSVATFTDSDHNAVPLRIDAFGRWISQYHLGIELGMGPGVWFTEDLAPAMLAGRVLLVSVWEDWGLLVGPEVSVMQSTLENDHALLLVTVPMGAEYRVAGSSWLIRGAVGPTAFSELKRQSGMPWLWFGVSYSPLE